MSLRSLSTARQRVLDVLIRANGEWVPGFILTRMETGGSEGLRRLRELKAAGYLIEKRVRPNSNAREYRLVLNTDTPALDRLMRRAGITQKEMHR